MSIARKYLEYKIKMIMRYELIDAIYLVDGRLRNGDSFRLKP